MLLPALACAHFVAWRMAVWAVAAVVLVLQGCANLPVEVTRTPSAAYTDTTDTPLARSVDFPDSVPMRD